MKKAGILLLILLVCYYFPKKHNLYVNHDGQYLLSAVTGKVIVPLFIYQDPQWAYYECLADKGNFQNWYKKMPTVKFTCGKYYEGTI